MPMDITVNLNKLLSDFRHFISKNWALITALDAADKSDALKIDWLQANWEMLVEQQLRNPKIILEVYGDGADNGKSSRIQRSEALPTHQIFCVPKEGLHVFDYLNKTRLDYTNSVIFFDRFVTLRPDGWYYEEPPFDKVLCYIKDKETVLSVEEVSFKIEAHTSH